MRIFDQYQLVWDFLHTDPKGSKLSGAKRELLVISLEMGIFSTTSTSYDL